jgi:sodium/bile acid cotransporter 7
MGWTMPGRSLAGELAHPWPALWAVTISYTAVPAFAWALGALAPVADLHIGLLLVSSVPCTLASAVLWTRLAGGNEATALFTVLGTTFISWLATTAWLTLTTGALVELAAGPLMLDLVLSLIVPVALGQLARLPAHSADFATRHKPLLSALAQLCVLAIVVKTGVRVGAEWHRGSTTLTPALFAWSVGLAVGLHLLALSFGLVTSGWLGIDRPRRLAIAFACSQKTLPVSLLLFESYYVETFPLAIVPVLFYHVGQLLLDTVVARHLRERGDVAPQAPG